MKRGTIIRHSAENIIKLTFLLVIGTVLSHPVLNPKEGGCVIPLDNVVDLSHTLGPDNLPFPGSSKFVFNILVRKQLPNYWYESNEFSTGEHIGTHMDSPSHFNKGKWRVDQIPANRFIGPLVKIDISERAKTNRDAEITKADLINWENQFGQIPKGAIILGYTGWDRFWPDRLKVFGDTDATTYIKNDKSKLHYPGWSLDAAKWLMDSRQLHAIGIDTPSLDFGQTTTFPVHVKVFGYNVYGLENVANLAQVPNVGATGIVVPIKLKDGSGCPVRILAIKGNFICETNDISKFTPYLSLIFICFMHIFINK